MIVRKKEANYTNLIKDYYISDTRVKNVFVKKTGYYFTKNWIKDRFRLVYDLNEQSNDTVIDRRGYHCVIHFRNVCVLCHLTVFLAPCFVLFVEDLSCKYISTSSVHYSNYQKVNLSFFTRIM